MNGLDARVRYTRMVIEQSFLELLKKKPVAKVTVTELCEKAQINRATFYKHYLDVPDLLEKIEEELFCQIRQSFDSENIKFKDFLTRMLRYTMENQERYFALGGENGDPNLMMKTFMVCYESAYPLLERNVPDMSQSERQMLYYYMSHGAGAVLTCWIQNGMKEPPEELAQFILSLCSITADGVFQPDWRRKYQE